MQSQGRYNINSPNLSLGSWQRCVCGLIGKNSLPLLGEDSTQSHFLIFSPFNRTLRCSESPEFPTLDCPFPSISMVKVPSCPIPLEMSVPPGSRVQLEICSTALSQRSYTLQGSLVNHLFFCIYDKSYHILGHILATS